MIRQEFVLAVTLVLATLVATTDGVAIGLASDGTNATVLGLDPRNMNLDKTWTTRGLKRDAGSQVYAITALASHGSFRAEGLRPHAATGAGKPTTNRPGLRRRPRSG